MRVWIGGIQMAEMKSTITKIDEIVKDINIINSLFYTYPIDSDKAKRIIHMIDEKHPDNLGLRSTFLPTLYQYRSMEDALPETLLRDLVWKRNFLYLKAIAKSDDDIVIQLRKVYLPYQAS